MTDSPRFPPELECDIFVLAFQDDHMEAKNLILVAKRVFDWIMPYVFRVVKLTPYEEFHSPIKFNEAVYKKHGHHTRHLFLSSNDLGKYLHLFPNLINLAFWIDHDAKYLPLLLQLPLKRISTSDPLQFFQAFASVAANVTHLDVTSGFSVNPDIATFESTLNLPKLTHLCLLNLLAQEPISVFLDQRRCPQLRVVILRTFVDQLGDEAIVDISEVPKVDDERVVVIKCQSVVDWKNGAQGGVDMWKLAEEVLERRRRDQGSM